VLTFIIPVRHHATAGNWAGVKARLGVTLRSLRAQQSKEWRAIIIANEGAALPDNLEGVDVVRVDFPPNKLDRAGPKEALYQSIRRDKGRRILAGLLHARPKGHVMVVDYDDVVSRRLAGFVAANPAANGWYVNAGYMFSGSRLMFSYQQDFFELCGTSHLIRADLLDLPDSAAAAHEEYICRTLGSHKFIKRDLEQRGTPLAPLPFPGAVYRMGHADTATGSSGMIRYNLRKESFDRPLSLVRQLAKFRFIGPGLAREFFDGAPA
jgi:hypothetical protein